MAIGVDVDQYYTYPEVQSALISSAMKNVDVAVYNYLKSVVGKTDSAGIVTANITNGGVGLADWLKDLSLTPPVSVTRPTFNFVVVVAAGVVQADIITDANKTTTNRTDNFLVM